MGQVGARLGQRFDTHVSDLRVGELNLREETARVSKRDSTRVGDLLVISVASALVRVLPCPLDQRVVVGGRCCWRRRLGNAQGPPLSDSGHARRRRRIAFKGVDVSVSIGWVTTTFPFDSKL